MKPKTKAFADRLLSNPKTSPTQAYIDTHITTNRDTAKVEASKLLTKPNVRIYMGEHVKKAKEINVEILNSLDDNSSISEKRLVHDVAESILDRELGKATQKTENTSVNLNLNLEANKAMGDAFTAFLSGSTTQS